MIRRYLFQSIVPLPNRSPNSLPVRRILGRLKPEDFLSRNCRKLSVFVRSPLLQQQQLQAGQQPSNQQHASLKERIDDLIRKNPVGTPLDADGSKLVANYISRCCKPRDALTQEIVENAQELHERLLKEEAFPVRNSVWAALIRGYATLGLFEQSKTILDQMEAWHIYNPDFYPSPNGYHYSTVIYACALNGSDEALQMAVTLIQVAEEKRIETIEMYNNLLLLHSRRAETVYGAAASAEDWLLKITQMASQPNPTITPNAVTFNLVLRAWKKTPEEQGAVRAHEILKLLCQVSFPDEVSFGTVISAYAGRGKMDEAEQLLREAVMYFRDRKIEAKLEQCLNEVCFGWAAQGKVDRILATIKRYQNFIPVSSHVTHGSLIEAYLRNNDVQGAENYLESMINEFKVKPTRREFGTILAALNRKNEAERAVQWLKRMVQYAEMRGFRCIPEPHDITNCLDTLRNSKSMAMEDVVEAIKEVAHLGITRRIVNAEGLAIAINYLCKVDQPIDAAELLYEMERLAETTSFRWPHYACGLYTVVIAAFSRQKDALSTENAYEVFKRMERQGPRAVQPTLKTYTALIVAFRHIPSRRSAEIVKELYKEIKSHDRDPNSKVQFDQRCFEQILYTMEEARTPKYSDWALQILTYMIKLHFMKERKNVEPTVNCLDATLRSLIHVEFWEDVVGLIEIMDEHHEENQLRHFPSLSVLEMAKSKLRAAGQYRDAAKVQKIIDKKHPNEKVIGERNIKIRL